MFAKKVNKPEMTASSSKNPDGTTLMKPDKIDVRLPKSIKPVHYLVKLQPFINGNFTIHGYVEIELMVIEETSTIKLHIADIITKNDTVKVIDCLSLFNCKV